MQSKMIDKSSKEYQKISWERLRKGITSLINKASVSNIHKIAPELFKLNLIRGRGLFCRAIMRAQANSPIFTALYASLVAVVNTKLPSVGELLITRLLDQFRKSYKRNAKVFSLIFSFFFLSFHSFYFFLFVYLNVTFLK